MLLGLTIWTLAASVVTAVLYAWDKRAAAKHRRRIAERTLLGWSVVGGWPGGWMASRILRHKTLKRSYRIRFVICALVNVAVVATVWHRFG
ncbi:hypothetical protein Poly41_40970 [Novipirellula artificiosorum]|uniref:DUF1294 domain-containing protein n=2 Tax=Novipirellula artificiosorum TaxID=2528016 RepID=A0A5C6DCJ3_9BACT|nr:hypothetical protein Poly41_40970 [Novipirellula artificiosorum]